MKRFSLTAKRKSGGVRARHVSNMALDGWRQKGLFSSTVSTSAA